ncbi:MAG: hypothetical protein K2X84_17445 [Beijerinckiaceae bacterium]|nr:hypothetical protein [Beijerinckiaceae bacterium]
MPDIIARNDRVVTINNTQRMDLQGQAAAESDGPRQISGTASAAAASNRSRWPAMSSPRRLGADLRRHRKRDGKPQGPLGGGAREGAHRPGASG